MGMITNPDGSLSWDFSGSNMLGGLQDLSAPTTAAPGVAPTFGAPAAPQRPGAFQYQSWGNSKGVGDYLGANGQLFGAGLNALSQGVGIYAGLKNLSLAKKSFGLQKEAYQTNLRNQTQSYNTQVADRINGRSYATEAERAAALAAAQLQIGG